MTKLKLTTTRVFLLIYVGIRFYEIIVNKKEEVILPLGKRAKREEGVDFETFTSEEFYWERVF